MSNQIEKTTILEGFPFARIVTFRGEKQIGFVAVRVIENKANNTVTLIYEATDRCSTPPDETIDRKLFDHGVIDRIDGTRDIISPNWSTDGTDSPSIF